jgi:hypothetical protein
MNEMVLEPASQAGSHVRAIVANELMSDQTTQETTSERVTDQRQKHPCFFHDLCSGNEVVQRVFIVREDHGRVCHQHLGEIESALLPFGIDVHHDVRM